MLYIYQRAKKMFDEYLGKFMHLNSIACIRSHDVDLIEQTITNPLINEGLVPISQPPFPFDSSNSSVMALSTK